MKFHWTWLENYGIADVDSDLAPPNCWLQRVGALRTASWESSTTIALDQKWGHHILSKSDCLTTHPKNGTIQLHVFLNDHFIEQLKSQTGNMMKHELYAPIIKNDIFFQYFFQAANDEPYSAPQPLKHHRLFATPARDRSRERCVLI